MSTFSIKKEVELKLRSGTQWLLRELRTDPKRGIDSSTIEARKAAYGSNEIPRAPPSSK